MFPINDGLDPNYLDEHENQENRASRTHFHLTFVGWSYVGGQKLGLSVSLIQSESGLPPDSIGNQIESADFEKKSYFLKI